MCITLFMFPSQVYQSGTDEGEEESDYDGQSRGCIFDCDTPMNTWDSKGDKEQADDGRKDFH